MTIKIHYADYKNYIEKVKFFNKDGQQIYFRMIGEYNGKINEYEISDEIDKIENISSISSPYTLLTILCGKSNRL